MIASHAAEIMSKATPPLTVAQLQQHPEFKNAIWDLKPTDKGKVDVAKERGGPFKIAYEVHGNGEHKLVVSLTYFLSRLYEAQGSSL